MLLPSLSLALSLSHSHTHTHTHKNTQSVRMCCVGCGRAAAVALTTVSLFSKRKAADVSRGSDRGEWNVGAIFELNTHTHTHTHTHTPNPLVAVSTAAVFPFLHLLHDTYCGTSMENLESLWTSPTRSKPCKYSPFLPSLSLSLSLSGALM